MSRRPRPGSSELDLGWAASTSSISWTNMPSTTYRCIVATHAIRLLPVAFGTYRLANACGEDVARPSSVGAKFVLVAVRGSSTGICLVRGKRAVQSRWPSAFRPAAADSSAFTFGTACRNVSGLRRLPVRLPRRIHVAEAQRACRSVRLSGAWVDVRKGRVNDAVAWIDRPSADDLRADAGTQVKIPGDTVRGDRA